MKDILKKIKIEDGVFVSSRTVQKQILFRMAGVSLLLAVVVGIGAYFSEIRTVTQEVEMLALEQVDLTVGKSLPLIQDPSHENIVLLEEQLKEDLESGSFVLLEIYSPEKEEIAQANIPGIEMIDRHAAYHTADLLKREENICRNFNVDGQIYVQVFTSLTDGRAGHVGFLEGLYRVPETKSAQISNRIFYTVCFVVLAVLGTVIILYPVIMKLVGRILIFSASLAEANIGMLVSMGAAVAKRDCDTDAHNYRVTILAVMIAEHIGLASKEIRILLVGSFLHDVGKIAIPDSILLKPGRLNGEEWKIMKTHVDHGVDVVSGHSWMAQAIPVVESHHEKFDGSGYPRGLSAEDIPLVARIFALADVFDALHSKRPYKDPMPFDKCIQIINESGGSHFDPALVDPFNSVARRFVEIDGLEETEVLRPLLAGYTEKYFKVNAA